MSPSCTMRGEDPGALGWPAEHHPQRIAPRDLAHRQLGIVRPDGARSYRDRVALAAQTVAVRPGLGPGDPARRPVRSRDATVEGGGQLQHHPWSPCPPVMEVGRERPLHRVAGDPHLDVDTGAAQRFDPTPRHPGVRVLHPHHHARHAGRDQGVGARRGATVCEHGSRVT